tara:strand:+ start:445 stop:591 length:147 start_codon:yes stop_codon:yes gene_type:complete
MEISVNRSYKSLDESWPGAFTDMTDAGIPASAHLNLEGKRTTKQPFFG